LNHFFEANCFERTDSHKRVSLSIANFDDKRCDQMT